MTMSNSLTGSVVPRGSVGGTIGMAKTKPLPWYEGEYEVTPKWEDIVLETTQKSRRYDVTITEIPYLEAENPQGGVTVVIGGL